MSARTIRNVINRGARGGSGSTKNIRGGGRGSSRSSIHNPERTVNPDSIPKSTRRIVKKSEAEAPFRKVVDKPKVRHQASKPVPRTVKWSGASGKPDERRVVNKKVQRKVVSNRKAFRNKQLNTAKSNDTVTGTSYSSMKTMWNSGADYFAENGWGGALKGTFKASAASAAGHGGLAYLQGDDPWEAAKTGAVRGAIGGIGYQTLKGATHASTTQKGLAGIWDNTKQIGRGVKDTYKSHSSFYRPGLKEEGISRQLQKILQSADMNRNNRAVNKLHGGV